jgi:hypothetical protein
MRLPHGRSIRIGTLLAACTLLWACVAPILTVPPPGAQISFTAAVITDGGGVQRTVWTTQGGPVAQAAFADYFVLDEALGSGVIATARADGSFMAPAMDGTVNDHVLVYYRTPAGDYSESLCVLLTAGSSPPVCP